MINDDALNNIEKLHKLKADGIITQEDFDKAKADLLSGTKRRAAAPVTTHTTETPTPDLPAADDFFGWVHFPLKRFTDFKGRSTRKEFWMFHLMYVGLVFVCAVLAIGVGGDGAVALMVLGWLALLVPLIAVQVRRFHDLNKSGWLALLNLVPYIGALILYVMMLFDGTPGDNSYGPDPKGRE